MRFSFVSVALIITTKVALASSLPAVTVWSDETGHDVVIAYGVTRATKMAELDRDKATLIARINLASYLKHNVISGSVVVREWRQVSDDKNGGFEVVAVEWSEASARSAAAMPK